MELKNASVSAEFGAQGLPSIEDANSGVRVDLARVAWSLAGTLDSALLQFKPAYSSTCADAAWSSRSLYADLCRIAPDVRHTIELPLSQMANGQLQEIVFDSVIPLLTEAIAP